MARRLSGADYATVRPPAYGARLGNGHTSEDAEQWIVQHLSGWFYPNGRHYTFERQEERNAFSATWACNI